MRHGGGRGRKGRPITLREMGEKVFEELKRVVVSDFVPLSERTTDVYAHV